MFRAHDFSDMQIFLIDLVLPPTTGTYDIHLGTPDNMYYSGPFMVRGPVLNTTTIVPVFERYLFRSGFMTPPTMFSGVALYSVSLHPINTAADSFSYIKQRLGREEAVDGTVVPISGYPTGRIRRSI